MTGDTPSKDHPLVEVAWYDAIEVNDWQDMGSFPNKPMLSWSVGYLVAEDEFAKYLKKQKIKVLKKEYVSSVITLIENALQSPEIGKTMKIEL
jgi:hypothetical protein